MGTTYILSNIQEYLRFRMRGQACASPDVKYAENSNTLHTSPSRVYRLVIPIYYLLFCTDLVFFVSLGFDIEMAIEDNMLSTGNEVRRTGSANREPPAIVAVIGTVGHVNNLRALLITLIM